MNITRAIFLLSLFLFLTACSSVTKIYPGEELADELTVRISLKDDNDNVIEHFAVNGHSVDTISAQTLPGNNNIEIVFKGWYANKELSNKASFIARVDRARCEATIHTKAGERYLVVLNQDGGIFKRGKSQPTMSVELNNTRKPIKGRCTVTTPE